MCRTGMVLLLSILALTGCGGGGSGSGGSNEALFGGPLMFVGAQIRIYGENNLQLADFNDDGHPELLYEVYDARENIWNLYFSPGSATEIFGEPVLPGAQSQSVIADFDGDGNRDIISSIYLGARGGPPYFDWSLLRGNGGNTFAEPELLNLPDTPESPISTVPADINGDGYEDLLSLGYLGEIIPFVNEGDGSFTAATFVQALTTSGMLVGADLNNDSFDDIVLLSSVGAGVSLSLGDGTFSDMETVVPDTVQLPPADFDNDGNFDLVRYSGGEDGILVFRGLGDGTFAEPLVSPISPFRIAGELAYGDFNGDTTLDLVLLAGDLEASSLCIALGNGDGTFTLNLDVIEAVVGGALPMDIDRDGNLDILAMVQDPAPFLRPYFGNGDGTFREEFSTFIDVDTGAAMVTETPVRGQMTTRPLDVDADGNLDLLLRNGTAANDLSLFLGIGDGTFAPERRIPVNFARFQQTSDLDADGFVDFFGQSLSSFFSILRNYGSGDLQPVPLIAIGVDPPVGFRFEGAFDLDQDDLLDPLFSFENGDIRVLYNLGNMQFEPLATVANIGDEGFQAIADITGDGYPDLVSDQQKDDYTVDVFFVRPGGPSRMFGPAVMSELPRYSRSSFVVTTESFPYKIADFNADGRADIARILDQLGGNNERTIVSLLQGQADGTLMHAQDAFVPFIGLLSQVVDLELDGDLDLVVSSVTLRDLLIFGDADRLGVHPLLTNGSGLFEPAAGVQTLIGDLFGEYDASVVDITGDGYPDALVYSETIGLAVALGQGDGTFGQPFYFRTGGGTEPAIGDFDNDGDGDFAAITAAGGQIEIIENRLVQE